MTLLVDRDIVHHSKGEPPLSADEISEYQPLVPKWELNEADNILRVQRVFPFKNFVQALELTNKVGELAESWDHHPLLITEWGRATVIWWTHTVKGLSENDFIMAAKTDALLKPDRQ